MVLDQKRDWKQLLNSGQDTFHKVFGYDNKKPLKVFGVGAQLDNLFRQNDSQHACLHFVFLQIEAHRATPFQTDIQTEDTQTARVTGKGDIPDAVKYSKVIADEVYHRQVLYLRQVYMWNLTFHLRTTVCSRDWRPAPPSLRE